MVEIPSFAARWLVAVGLIASASAALAAPPRPPLSAAEAQRVRQSVQACSGGVGTIGKITTVRTVADHAASLPTAGDDAAQWTNGDRAWDVYTLAHALLVPAVPDAERARDRTSFIKCPPDAASGTRLLAFLAGERPGDLLGPNNALYWLAEAYRRGAGVARDPKRARELFLRARIMGQERLIAADWGERPDQPLAERLAQPAARAWLEEAAALGRPAAQHALADLVLPTDTARARRLFEAAVAQADIGSILRFARLELDGGLGPANPAHAVEMVAALRAPPGTDPYTLMIEAARRFDGMAEIPVAARKLTPADVGSQEFFDRLDPVDVGRRWGRSRRGRSSRRTGASCGLGQTMSMPASRCGPAPCASIGRSDFRGKRRRRSTAAPSSPG